MTVRASKRSSKKRTMTKRFYVGSPRMTEAHGDLHHKLMLYGEALEAGKRQLVNDPNRQEIYIVEIVAVIQREDPPMRIEEIRR